MAAFSTKIRNPMTSQLNSAAEEIDFQNCQKSKFVGTNLVKCLMEHTTCQWAMAFGNERFCNHLSAKEFDNSNLQKRIVESP